MSPRISHAEILAPQEFTQNLPQFEFLGGVSQSVANISDATNNPLSWEEICDTIYEAVSRSKPFTQGLEWDIYKIQLWSKSYVVVKKRKNDGGNEYSLHREALKILSKWLAHTSLMSIPKLYGRFDEEEGPHSFIVMEFIEGKTLYNLMCASVIDYWKKKAEKNSRVANALVFVKLPTPSHVPLEQLPRGITIASDHEVRTGISFEHDGIAEETMQSVYEELLRAWAISEIGEGKNHRLFRDIKDAPIFTEGEFSQIRTQVSVFLKLLHAEWFYHRDIADNPRNLMFWEDGRIYFIDFGRSLKIAPSSTEEPYIDAKSWGVYTDDNHLIPYLHSLTNKPQVDEASLYGAKVEAYKERINTEELVRVALLYGISRPDIIRFTSNMKHGSSVGALSQYFDRTRTTDLHFTRLRDGFFLARTGKKTPDTKEYAMLLIAQLAMLSKEELRQLREVIAEKNNKNQQLQKIYLMYIDQFLKGWEVTESA